MADEDNKNTPDQKPGEDLANLRSEIDNKLLAVTKQLEAMNNSFAQGFAALAPKPKQETIDESDVFDPAKLRDKILNEATRTTNAIIEEERRKNATLVQLSKEYPEIQSDSKFQDAVVEAQKSLPKSIQDTAEGYELAVMKAVARQGILPKSKRPEPQDQEFSAGPASGSSARERGPRKAKLDPMTVEMARLLGRDVNDKEVIKRLEEASQRDQYSRYR